MEIIDWNEELVVWYNRVLIPFTCRVLSSKRDATKVQLHNGIKRNDVQMLSSQPQSDNRQAALLCLLLVLVVLSPGNERQGSLDVS